MAEAEDARSIQPPTANEHGPVVLRPADPERPDESPAGIARRGKQGQEDDPRRPLGKGRVHWAVPLSVSDGPQRCDSGDVWEDDRVHRDASRFLDASTCHAVFSDAGAAKVDAGKIERAALELLESAGRRRFAAHTDLVRSPVAEAASDDSCK
jgi:hypothetical protein